MASAIAVGNVSHYFSNARWNLQRDTEFTVKELTELRTPTGARTQVYPPLDSTALSVEVEHAFETNRQAVINQLLNSSDNPSSSARCFTSTPTSSASLFDPENFSNEHYSNAAVITVNAAVLIEMNPRYRT